MLVCVVLLPCDWPIGELRARAGVQVYAPDKVVGESASVLPLFQPAYLHLRQRVDNFVSNHLSNHTWSPQLNKNQLRNSIRQLVLQYVSRDLV